MCGMLYLAWSIWDQGFPHSFTFHTTGPQGHVDSKKGPAGGTGPGPPALHQTVRSSSWHTLWCNLGPPLMP